MEVFAPDSGVFLNQFIEKLRRIENIGEDFSKYQLRYPAFIKYHKMEFEYPLLILLTCFFANHPLFCLAIEQQGDIKEFHDLKGFMSAN